MQKAALTKVCVTTRLAGHVPGNYGHFSPISAYDPASDSVLIASHHYQRCDPVWVASPQRAPQPDSMMQCSVLTLRIDLLQIHDVATLHSATHNCTDTASGPIRSAILHMLEAMPGSEVVASRSGEPRGLLALRYAHPPAQPTDCGSARDICDRYTKFVHDVDLGPRICSSRIRR